MAGEDKIAGLLAGLLLSQGVKLEDIMKNGKKESSKKGRKSVKEAEVDSEEEEEEDEDEDGKGTVDKKDDLPAGSVCEIKNLYQSRDKHDQLIWVNEYPEDLDEPVENQETAKFALIIRNKKSYDTRKKLEIDSIIIQSPVLKQCLEPVLKDYPGVTVSLERLTFSAPFAPFVHRYERFLEAVAKTEEGSEAQNHMTLLQKVLDTELSDIIATKKDHVANGVITFNHMWTIFEPGALMYGVEDEQERIFQLISTGQSTDRRTGREYVGVRAWSVDWDGEKFGKSETFVRNFEFPGTTRITHLQSYPLVFHPQKEQLMQRLLARGKIFENFAGYHYKAYRGVALGYNPYSCDMVKVTVDSRIIVDTAAHNRFLPNKAISVSSLPKKASDVSASEDYDDGDYATDYDTEYESDSEAMITPSSSANAGPKHRPLTDRELMMTVPFVRGYSLKNKKWLWFYVSAVTDIVFNTNAFSSLVLPPQQKDLIHAFVESQLASPAETSGDDDDDDATTQQAPPEERFDDIITGKGLGMILLLSGPPGVGKTLTAESVAESLQVPLYMMSAGDLGLEPSDIERSLSTIMEMVSKWRAVLLLDEADVFLESRSNAVTGGHDLERNKMVSIFLRVLEYYEGILFLTTNRLKDIDEAFHSRIHISMQYPPLTRDSRLHIWQTFLGRSTGTRSPNPWSRFSATDREDLADLQVNGRQIKNLVKTAGMLARTKKGRRRADVADGDADDGLIKMSHIRTVWDIERGNSWN